MRKSHCSLTHFIIGGGGLTIGITLTKTHFISQNTIKMVVIERYKPLQALDLGNNNSQSERKQGGDAYGSHHMAMAMEGEREVGRERGRDYG